MNDERIIEYLRARHAGQLRPPSGAVASIMRAVDEAVPQRSWFASLIPAAAVVVVGVVAVLVFMALGQDVGPTPDPTASPTTSAVPSAGASPSPIPSPTPTSRPCCPLLKPGDTADLPATDNDGEWGSIRLERGDDLGGYPDAAIPGDTFVIEVFVTYDPQRMPEPAQFGRPDWAVRPIDAPADRFFVIEAQEFERANGIGLRPAMPLGVWPGAADIFTTPTEGRIAFAVPRRDADLSLELVYRLGDDEQVFALRDPGPAPEPVAVATPQPTSDTAIAEAAAVAAELFTQTDECINPEDGYRLTFPDAWYTNTATGDVPACSWFTPEFFEVAVPGEAPDEIWIGINVFDGVTGYTSITEIYLNEELSIGGRQAFRVEFNPNVTTNPDFRGYHYVIPLGENGPTLAAGTSTDQADNYLLARFVLDRIMASFSFTP
jgi:hypothetical protein